MRRVGYLIGLLVVLLSQPAAGSTAGTEHSGPRLLLLLAVDQARYEYLERFCPVLSGGLKRLVVEGVVFSNAHQNHAFTTTGPGHASLVTGMYPAHSGIVNNSWYDRIHKKSVYCVEDPAAPLVTSFQDALPWAPPSPSGAGRSPRNLLVTSLGDWIRANSPTSKVFSAGRKDRAAILMGGAKADAAYWYDRDTGSFVTSRYYRSSLPEWVLDFHRRRIPESWFGKVWEPLPVSAQLRQKMQIDEVDGGAFHTRFPRPLGGLSLHPDARFYGAFGSSPMMEDYLVEFAKALIESEGLGRDETLDLLTLSFAALDSVGHGYGPNSPEVLDAVQRLDRSLGTLFQYLDENVGRDRFWVALSADHGVMPLPEYLQQVKNRPGSRLGVEDITCFQQAGLALSKKFRGFDWWLSGAISSLYFDYQAIAQADLRRREVEAELIARLETCPHVEKVWSHTQLEAAAFTNEPYSQLFLNSFHPDRSPDLLVQFKKFHLASGGRGTSHGSPYAYDTQVPILFWSTDFPAAKIAQRMNTVDLAPTLASLLKVTAPQALDGSDLSHLVRGASKSKRWDCSQP